MQFFKIIDVSFGTTSRRLLTNLAHKYSYVCLNGFEITSLGELIQH